MNVGERWIDDWPEFILVNFEYRPFRGASQERSGGEGDRSRKNITVEGAFKDFSMIVKIKISQKEVNWVVIVNISVEMRRLDRSEEKDKVVVIEAKILEDMTIAKVGSSDRVAIWIGFFFFYNQ